MLVKIVTSTQIIITPLLSYSNILKKMILMDVVLSREGMDDFMMISNLKSGQRDSEVFEVWQFTCSTMG